MTDRPIIFSAPMIRALLNGKTQTRRVFKPQPGGHRPNLLRVENGAAFFCQTDHPKHHHCEKYEDRFPLPYAPGDRLWVREAWQHDADSLADARASHEDMMEGPVMVFYRATEVAPEIFPGWRSPIHMPRWASRLTLTVSEVRIQRVQDISAEDAIAEGIYRVDPSRDEIESGICTPQDFVFMAPGTRQGWGLTKAERNREQWGPTAPFAFRCVWDSIHGPDAWVRNDWVAALTFTMVQRNIDEVAS